MKRVEWSNFFENYLAGSLPNGSIYLVRNIGMEDPVEDDSYPVLAACEGKSVWRQSYTFTGKIPNNYMPLDNRKDNDQRKTWVEEPATYRKRCDTPKNSGDSEEATAVY